MKLEAGKFYKTRDGRKAFVAGIDPFNTSAGNEKIVGFIEKRGSTDWDEDGRFVSASDPMSIDLVEEWKELESGEFWNVVCRNSPRLFSFETEKEARAFLGVMGFEAIACFSGKWVEGQGIEVGK